MPFVFDILRDISNNLNRNEVYRLKLAQDLLNTGIEVSDDSDTDKIEALKTALLGIPKKLIIDCGINKLGFEDLGPSAKYYPNHGKYQDSKLILNTYLFKDPPVGKDDEGNDISHIKFVLAHEMGHGYDEIFGKKDSDEELCKRPEWLDISGWSREPKKGLKRLIINEKGYSTIKGEWYYSPDAKFCRFYGKRNPWDDWADTFAYYVINFKNKIPESKLKYFDKLLFKYYK